ncbi:MAG: replication-associated recombination protein A [Chloroflexota bacterium]
MPARRSTDATPEHLGLDPAVPRGAPLAARMRPVDLDAIVGQVHLLGPGGALRRMVERGHLASMVLWGPPGVGKTTIARLLADAVGAPFATLSAVSSGVADVRAVVARARGWVDRGGRTTVLFLDEIHRFNRAQQDALLPHVEDGTLVLVGATTENPYFEVNAALLSRMRVFRLEPLTTDELGAIVDGALADARGLRGAVRLADDARAHLLDIVAGDARAALNILEAAAALVLPPSADATHPVDAPDGAPLPSVAEGAATVIGLDAVEAAAQQRILAYDRAGDGHYGTVSAFIKSMRGNDPDAALYWLAAMVAAGEDPRFIARRIIIAASEDVGNGDPRALQVAVAAAQALEQLGLPEGQYALAQAACYVAVAPKSDRAGRAYFAALEDVRGLGSLPVPPHLLNASVARMRSHGIGVGYRLPHDYPGGDVAQQYLPDRLAGRRYYVPTEEGMERQIGDRLARLAEARAAADAAGGPRRRRGGER